MSDVKIDLASKVIPKFHDFMASTYNPTYTYYVLAGGRASAKSSSISQKLILDAMEYPINTLVVRKVANTLKESVYEQLKWAIENLGVSHLWEAKKSPLELIYKERGNRILFRGADDPSKLKGIKSADFPITNLWVEEVAEFKTEDEVSVITNSIIRGVFDSRLQKMGLDYKIYYSYNPPKRKQHWLNKKFETQFIPNNIYFSKSSYLDNPFISRAFIDEANEVKANKPFKYRWEYLGEPIGSGVVPFDNLEFRTITDEEIEMFDNIRQGNDFGYATDPMAFVRLHYDKKKRIIYFIDEIYGVKMSIRELASTILKRGYNDTHVTCDGAEPRSIAELREHGVKALKAKKGPGSVEFGENWLDDLEAIVIDPKRTPNVAKEFENIDYMTDKDGNVRPKLEDKDNHSIDSTRYALELDMKTHGRERTYNSR